jgi:subtilisin-like proprotein convertase family protein
MMYFRNTKTYDTSYTATDVPKVISPARETTVVSVYHNSISKIVLDVDCWFSINHTYDADMTMSLISPAGTEIILTGGTGGGGHNYVDTYFDDEAMNPIDDTANHAPFTGHFRPVQRLWFFDGENSGGDWKLKIVDNGPSDGGELVSWGMKFRYSAIDDNVIYPDKFSLVGNYPNPFNPRTRILFNLPYAADVKIVLYDITGREVKKLLNERRGPALEDFIDFDISSVDNVSGGGLASGVYFYSLIADGKFIESKKMVLLK